MYKNKSISSLLYLSLCFLYTKIFFANSRLIRLPIDLRNHHKMNLGNNLTTGKNCRVEAFGGDRSVTLSFGSNVQINDNVHITASSSVQIGSNVLLASRVYISDTSHGSYSGDQFDSHPDLMPSERPLIIKPVTIEDNVWICENVSILPGSFIGKGSIIGANAVVSGNIPSYSIAVGVPARVIKRFNHLKNQWQRV